MQRVKQVFGAMVLMPVVIWGFFALTEWTLAPFWHLEELTEPVHVESVTGAHLILVDGRQVPLPFLKQIPYEHPLFLAAIKEGVEWRKDGEVLALMWLQRNCGNDPCIWRHIRINLSDLGAALTPEGLDASLVHADLIHLVQDTCRIERHSAHGLDPPSLTALDVSKMRRVREYLSYAHDTKAKKVIEPKSTSTKSVSDTIVVPLTD